MASSDPLCDICKRLHISKPADVWCSECDEALCAGCDQQHSLAKITKNHKRIAISDYCRTTSDSIVDVEQNLSNIYKIYGNLKEKQNANVNNIDRRSDDLRKQVREFRKKMDAHLDRLEEEIITSINDTSEDCKHKINSFSTELTEKLDQVNAMMTNLTKLKQHGSNIKMFLGTKEMEKAVDTENAYIASLEKNKEPQNFDFTLDVSEKVKSFDKLITSFGSVTVHHKSSDVCLGTKTGKQAQLFHPIHEQKVKDIDEIVLTKRAEFFVGKNFHQNITGCIVLPNSNVFLVIPNSKAILLFTDTGTLIKRYDIGVCPFDVCLIRDHSIGVSFCGSKGVCTYNTRLKKIEHQTPTEDYAYGLECYKDNLYCRVYGVGIQVFNLNCEPISRIEFSGKSIYISICADRIYYPCDNDRSIVCSDMDGNTIYKLEGCPKITDSINGISTSTSCKVYAVDFKNNKLLVFSGDGKKTRTLLDSKDGLRSPNCVHFNYDNNILLVCNYKDRHVFLYDVS